MNKEGTTIFVGLQDVLDIISDYQSNVCKAAMINKKEYTLQEVYDLLDDIYQELIETFFEEE